MARRLRLHFASRRSSTDPLSESLGSHGERSGVGAAACSPGEILAQNSVLLKVTALSPDNANLQQRCSGFGPQARTGGCSKKSIVQISLQTRGQVSGDLNGTVEDGDPAASDGGPGSGSDGGSSSSSSMASDAGYCSSNSIFEPEAPEKLRSSQERSQRGRKPVVPLRRCSSLVIFPKSPCNTPPASPVSPVAAPLLLPPARGSHQSTWLTSDREPSRVDPAEAACKGSANVPASGRRLKKEGSAEFKDTKHMVQFNIPLQDEPGGKMEEASREIELSPTIDRSNRHSSSLLLHFGQQRPRKGAAASSAIREGHLQAPNPPARCEGEQDPARKLYRSTSACLFSSTKSLEKNPRVCSLDSDTDVPEKKLFQRAIQRSFSLEVPYANTGILCHVSNPKLSSPCSPHVHIHLSPCYPAKLPNSVTDANTSHKGGGAPDSPSLSKKVSVMFLN